MDNKKENLVPEMTGAVWNTWVPREVQTPAFEIGERDGSPVLVISSGGNPQCYGIWQCDVNEVKGGGTYKFSVEYNTQNVEDDHYSIYCMLTWMIKGKMITRDYVDSVSERTDGWVALSRTIDAPEEADSVKIELAFRWSEHGKVYWRNPALEVCEPIQHRIVRVATTYLASRQDMDKNLKATLDILDRAGKQKADIICLTETFYDRGVNLPLVERCETVNGRLVQEVSGKAREYGAYVVLCFNEKDGDYCYNTSLLIDRKGHIAGSYRKMQLPLSEAEAGTMPGNDYPVFETDFGKVGIMICWDQCFPEVARILRLKGAEMIFVPTIGDAPVQSISRAIDNGIHVIVSGSDGPKPSRIVDPKGEIIGELASGSDGVVTADIDLDKRFYTFWLSVGPAFGEASSIYIKERRAGTFRRQAE
jgi:predicted amidohydrolase